MPIIYDALRRAREAKGRGVSSSPSSLMRPVGESVCSPARLEPVLKEVLGEPDFPLEALRKAKSDARTDCAISALFVLNAALATAGSNLFSAGCYVVVAAVWAAKGVERRRFAKGLQRSIEYHFK